MDFGIRNWKNLKSLKEALDLTVQTWKLQVGVYNEDVKLKVIMLLTMMIVMMRTMTHFRFFRKYIKIKCSIEL